MSGPPERASPPPVQQLAALSGLKPAQAALTLEVAYGEGGLRASAKRLGIAYVTARAHLAAVFGKTGARTQAERVARRHSHDRARPESW